MQNSEDPTQALEYAADLLKDSGRASEAVPIAERFAAVGNPRAIGLLATMYAYGMGVPRDAERAEDLFRRAIELGDGLAAHNCGVFYQVHGS